MKVVFFGSKDRGVLCLEELLKQNWVEVEAVITYEENDPNKYWKSNFMEYALKRGLKVYYIPRKINADVYILCAYNRKLPKEIIATPKKGTINLHAGKLPEYRGASVMNWAITNGETKGACTIHYVTEEIDAGDILAEEFYEIKYEDTIEDVRKKVNSIFPKLLISVLEQIDNNAVKPRKQDERMARYWPSRKPEDGMIDWSKSSREIYNFVRALTRPYPGAYTYLNGKKVYVWKVTELGGEDIRIDDFEYACEEDEEYPAL